MTHRAKILFLLWFIAVIVLCWEPAVGQLVPFLSDPTYERDEPVNPPWFVHNNGQPSHLYHNGVYVSQESGNDDLGLLDAWASQPEGARVGLIDLADHGIRVRALVHTVSPASVIDFIEQTRIYPEQLADGIITAASLGDRVVVITAGSAVPNESLSNACRYAEAQNILICCAVPNTEGNLDTSLSDYPYRYSWEMTNILGVNCTDRSGLHFNPSATGTNVLGAPGRNIVAAGTYSSGTSWATPILAGCAALLIQRYPGQPVENYIAVLKATAVGSSRRVSIGAAMLRPVPSLAATRQDVAVYGYPGWRYMLEHSTDLSRWVDLSPIEGGGQHAPLLGYFRVRVR